MIEMIADLPRTTDVSLARAVRDQVLLAGLTPASVSTQDAHPGDTTVWVRDADLEQFSVRQFLTFYDNLGEEGTIGVPIASDWDGTNPVTLDYTGVTPAGLEAPHPSGTVVGVNLLTYAPEDFVDMLTGIEPAVFIEVLDERLVRVGDRQAEPVFTVHLEYRRRLSQPKPADAPGAPAQMHATRWSGRQELAARLDMDALAKLLETNVELQNAQGAQVIDVTDSSNPAAPMYTKNWSKIPVDPDTWHFAAEFVFAARGFRRIFLPNPGF